MANTGVMCQQAEHTNYCQLLAAQQEPYSKA